MYRYSIVSKNIETEKGYNNTRDDASLTFYAALLS